MPLSEIGVFIMIKTFRDLFLFPLEIGDAEDTKNEKCAMFVLEVTVRIVTMAVSHCIVAFISKCPEHTLT